MLPNFLVIGAAKSGTTSLYHYLKQHPEVFMSPVKEPLFFAAEGGTIEYAGPDGRLVSRPANKGAVTEIGAYERLFDGVTDEKAVGEVSPMYLYVPKAPERIQHRIPSAKLVAVLRNPVERAYSAYLQRDREGREPLSDFREALRAEEGRMRDGWGLGYHYKARGLYHEQLLRYHEAFGRGSVRVYLYEDLNESPAAIAKDAFRYLGVDDTFAPDTSRRHNAAGVPRNAAVRALVRRMRPVTLALRPVLRSGPLQKVKRGAFGKPPPMPEETRRELIEYYREDVLKLQDLIGRDLSGWLDGERP
jgi:hypothetical protein